MSPAVTIRRLTEADLAEAHALTLGFGWPHRLEDWAFMLHVGGGVAAQAGGRLAGTALAWPFAGQAASIGMVCVDPALQGQGIGRRLMAELLEQSAGRILLLHATDAGRPLYEKLGFVADGRISQLQGLAVPDEAVASAGPDLRPAVPADLDAILRLDRAATGLDRTRLLTGLLHCSDGAILENGGVPAGYVLWRRFGRGIVIGPAAAADQNAAQRLIAHAVRRNPGAFMRIDIPDGSGLAGWLQRLGLQPVGGGLRMVRGSPPIRDAGPRLFALASQGFG